MVCKVNCLQGNKTHVEQTKQARVKECLITIMIAKMTLVNEQKNSSIFACSYHGHTYFEFKNSRNRK